MGRFIARRIALVIPVLFILIAVMFGLQRFTPADPVAASIGRGASPAIVAALRRKLGYDSPLVVQFLRYAGDVVRGDLGTSLRTHNHVTSDLGQTVPNSLELVAAAFFLALIGALVLGVASATMGPLAKVVRWLLLAGSSAPVFLAALILVIVFYHDLHWLPATGQTSLTNAPTGPTGFLLLDSLLHGDPRAFGNAITHLVLPAACLAIGPAVAIGRVLASAMSTNVQADYVRTARSKGLGQGKIIFKHALRNCLNGALAMTGLQVGAMFAGIVVVEDVFAWPGLGNYTAQSIASDDFPAILGTVLVIGCVYVLANLLMDILQATADPRIAL